MAYTLIPTELILDNAVTSAKLDTNIAVSGTLTSTGVLTANAGVVVDNFTLDGTTLALSSGNFTIDVAGNIVVDTDTGYIQLADAGTVFGSFKQGSSNLEIKAEVQDKDVLIKGNDNGTEITALTFDMSDAGAATFNSAGTFGGTVTALTNFNSTSGNDLRLNAGSANRDIFMQVNGTTHMTVQGSTGNVGIGTANPQAKLHLLDTDDVHIQLTDSGNVAARVGANGTAMVFGVDGSNGTTERLRITNAGNVGIGTTSPTVPLQINHGSSSVGLYTLGGYNYQAKFESSDAEAAIVIEDSNSGTDYNRIGVITNDMTFTTNNSERMRINSTGAMTRPNHPCFDVTTSTGGLTGTIAFNTVNIDNNSNYSTSNGRFTAPVAGSYMFYTQYIKQNSSAVMRRRFDKNGSSALDGREIRLDGGNNYGYGSMTIIIDLAAGDYVTVNQTAGAAHGGSTYEAFGGHLIG